MRARCLLVVALALAACGIRGAPRPPLDEPEPEPRALVAPPDAGCCREKK